MNAVADGTQSAMPAFGPDRLSESDLDDLASAICRRCVDSIRRSVASKEAYARHD